MAATLAGTVVTAVMAATGAMVATLAEMPAGTLAAIPAAAVDPVVQADPVGAAGTPEATPAATPAVTPVATQAVTPAATPADPVVRAAVAARAGPAATR